MAKKKATTRTTKAASRKKVGATKSPKRISKAKSKPAKISPQRSVAKSSKKVKSVVKSKSPARSSTPSKNINKAAVGGDPMIGRSAEALALPMTGGKNFSVKDFAGKKVVLYFYPKDMTPGCTQEGHDFTRLAADFKALNTVVLGVSRDSVASHEKFKAKENYAIDLLSDTEGSACALFDVIKEKNMYGKKVMGIERSTFVLNEKGVIIQVWRKVKVDGHAEEVLSFIQQLG